MKSSHCRYLQDWNDTYVACTNTRDMLHSGTLPITDCMNCFYRRPVDFFSQTEAMFRADPNDYPAAPRTCGTCQQPKQRNAVTQFVYPYWHAGATADEIRFSIRSVNKFFDGKALCTIVGDRPPWWNGHVINCPRIPPGPNRGFNDMVNKMVTISSHPEVHSQFVWMMDDIYFLKPVTLAELSLPRAILYREARGNSWSRRKSNTMRLLREKNRPNHDYATHLPHVAEKAKLATIVEEFDLRNNCVLWECLYGNTYRPRPYSVKPFFARLTDPSASVTTIAERCHRASVMNHLAQCFTPEMRQFLSELLPEPVVEESTKSAFIPDLKRKRPMRRGRRPPVKRRPKAPT